MPEVIKSTRNDKIKEIRSLGDKKKRRTEHLFVAEGYNIIKDMPFFTRVRNFFINEKELDKCLSLTKKFDAPVYVVADFVFDSIANTENASGILAVISYDDCKKVEGDTVLVCDGISDAGNMGTIIRTASAMGVKTVVASECVDFYNPKVVRSTMGGIFHVNLVEATKEELPSLLDGYDIACLDMAGKNIFDYKVGNKLAVVVGSEAHGISQTSKAICKDVLSIPMPSGNMESLNAGVSVGIALAVLAHNKNF